MGDKKKTKFSLIMANYMWLESQAATRGISMNAVINELINEKRGQLGVKSGSSVARKPRVN